MAHEALSSAAPSIRTRVSIPVCATTNAQWLKAEAVTFDGLHDGLEHIALVFRGMPEVPIVRLHSECLTGDVFGSARCDCGPQLREAIERMVEGGLILYLRQEGRGIGLYNKLDAYRLQDGGVDTYAANRMLNFQADARDYRAAAQMLLALGIDAIRLLSSNPDKAEQLRANGVRVVEVIPTGIFTTAANRRYLQAKADIAGHLISSMKDTE